jgi:sugar phosphate isomerase/epimerase
MSVNWVAFPGGDVDVADPTPVQPITVVLDAVAAAGFDLVGLDHYSVGEYVRAGGSIDALGAALRDHGLRCSDVGIVPVGSADLVPATERLADLARAVAAPLCIAALYDDLSHGDAVRDLCRAAEILEPAGVRIAFEFTAYGYRRSLADAVAICEEVGWERCALLVDAWHIFRGGESLERLGALVRDRVALVHVDDGSAEPLADATFEGRFRRRLPGTGAFDLDGFLRALDAAGYRGPFGVEVLSTELRGLPPAEAARQLRNSFSA